MQLKKTYTLLLLLLLLGCAKNIYDKVRKTPHFKYVPPETVWLKDSLFIDKYEVTNGNYHEFLFWLQYHKSPLYKLMLPDTLVWRKKLSFQQPMLENYFRHPAYDNCPVVGISYRQAEQFCAWRTDRVNDYLYITKNKLKWNPDTEYNSPRIVEYRLPTKQEWEYAAQAGLDYKKYPLGYEKLTDKKGNPVTVLADEEYNDAQSVQDSTGKEVRQYNGPAVKFPSTFTPMAVDYGKPNKYGIYNMLGNVSEIISDSIYMGLNYSTYISGTSLDSTTIYTVKSTYPYRGPEAWLGFRCVCELLKQP